MLLQTYDRFGEPGRVKPKEAAESIHLPLARSATPAYLRPSFELAKSIEGALRIIDTSSLSASNIFVKVRESRDFVTPGPRSCTIAGPASMQMQHFTEPRFRSRSYKPVVVFAADVNIQ
jgi:hypothetical protein